MIDDDQLIRETKKTPLKYVMMMMMSTIKMMMLMVEWMLCEWKYLPQPSNEVVVAGRSEPQSPKFVVFLPLTEIQTLEEKEILIRK